MKRHLVLHATGRNQFFASSKQCRPPKTTSTLPLLRYFQIFFEFFQTIGHISGCHINPAVTLSLFVTGDIKLLRALLFVVVQLIGAVGGAAVLRVKTQTFPDKNENCRR